MEYLTAVPVSISGCDEVTCTISGEVLLESEAELEQVQVLASPSDIHSEFVSLWAPRWQKHAAVSDAAWQRVMDFAKAFLPSFRFELPPLTVSMCLGAARRYKPRAARGPDSIAKSDLLNLPDSCTRQLLDLLADVEVGHDDWPQQLLTGLVCLLSKGNKRLDAKGYRPICLFSMVYRTWAGLRARQMLRQLTQHMDFEAFGFLPGHEATELWYSVQADVELCCQGGQELLGFSSDLVKAFNNLPRVPLRHVALHLGFPMTLIRPWFAFLAGVQRRVNVRQCVSRPLLSTSGFPEGCPLSPLAMVVADWTYHAYMHFFSPSARSLSYVDNLAATTPSLGSLAQSIMVTQTFCELLDLELDGAKSYVWSTNPAHRAALQQLPGQLCDMPGSSEESFPMAQPSATSRWFTDVLTWLPCSRRSSDREALWHSSWRSCQ